MTQKTQKKKPLPLTPEQRKLVDKIREWAHLDSKKEPEKFSRLFDEIWESQFKKDK